MCLAVTAHALLLRIQAADRQAKPPLCKMNATTSLWKCPVSLVAIAVGPCAAKALCLRMNRPLWASEQISAFLLGVWVTIQDRCSLPSALLAQPNLTSTKCGGLYCHIPMC